MNCQHLDPEEFGVECELRNLHGSLFTLVKKLTTILDSESKDGDEPQRPHEKARKQPKREIVVCENKLRELQTMLTEILSSENIDFDSIEVIQSRLWHVQSRLTRISGSASVTDIANKLSLSCDSFLAAIASVLKDQSNRNNSMDVIRAVQLEIPLYDGQEDNVDDAEIPKDDAVPGTSKQIDLPHPLASTGRIPSLTSSNVNIHDTIADISLMLENLSRKSGLHVPKVSENKNQNTFSIEGQSNARDISENVNVLPNTSHHTRKYPTHLQVQKWNINFNPSSKETIPIEQFLYRVEHLAKVYKISHNDLVNDVQFLLSGEACQYYWLFLKTTSNLNWADLKVALVTRFKDRKTDFDIKFELHSRKQNVPRETFLEFYNAVLTISYTLKVPLSDSDLIDLLMRNMRDGLMISLAGESFTSIQELVKRCVALEDSWSRIGYIPENNLQRRRNVSELGECQQPQPMNNSSNELNNYSFDASVSALAQSYNTFNKASISTPNNRTCWNCDAVGLHHWIDCTDSVKRKFCYGCGAKNTLKPNCVRCSTKSGNLRSEVKVTGSIPFRNNEISLNQPQTEEAASNTDPELYRRQHNH